MAREVILENNCVTHARKLGGKLVKLKTPGSRGFPDRLLILREFVAFIEFKHPGGTGRVDPLQRVWIDYLLSMGHRAYVVDSFAEFVSICSGRKQM